VTRVPGLPKRNPGLELAERLRLYRFPEREIFGVTLPGGDIFGVGLPKRVRPSLIRLNSLFTNPASSDKPARSTRHRPQKQRPKFRPGESELPIMKIATLFLMEIALLISLCAACASVPVNDIPAVYADTSLVPRTKTMRAFHTDQEIADYLRKLAAEQRGRQRESLNAQAQAAGEPQPSTAPMSKSDDARDKDEESVTNVQHAGVDEGGIVKLHGNHLVVLRRGRLFTVAIGAGALQSVSLVNAFGPEIDPRGTWYDEMLVSEDTIAVIGYSYQRGGTEVGLFNIDRDGNLSYRSTYHLRSNDYYSSRNYASRLIGNKLIFYTPLYLSPGAPDPFQTFPAVRKWHKGATAAEFQRIAGATQIYRPEQQLNADYGLALHTVTVCDLSGGGFQCQATSVIGPAGRVFYVSPSAVYVWTTDWAPRANQRRERSMLYRLPLDGSGPGALEVSGSPVDQFSFLESDQENLYVLVRADGAGDAMWSAEGSSGDVALLRVPLQSLSDGSQVAPASSYLTLAKPRGTTFQNRFVGDYLLYGTGSGWGGPENVERPSLFAVRWASGESHELMLAHGVDRIEALGNDAVVVGTDGKDLHFSAVRLGDEPEVVYDYARKNASQGELRSHGFFYKADGPHSGVLGLPISEPGRAGYRHLLEESASILFLENHSLHFEEIGALTARPKRSENDQCRASCVDWYGNSRPLFVRGRVFALLGYEIVEGTVDFGRIHETRRINYAPRRMEVTRGE
jgi:hypothetical protein